MFGYYLALADNDGIIGRIEDWNYDTYYEAARYGQELAIAEHCRFV